MNNEYGPLKISKDPSRIPRIGTKVMMLWSVHPELRLGQFMVCLHSLAGSTTDMFYIEDEEWEKVLDKEIFSF